MNIFELVEIVGVCLLLIFPIEYWFVVPRKKTSSKFNVCSNVLLILRKCSKECSENVQTVFKQCSQNKTIKEMYKEIEKDMLKKRLNDCSKKCSNHVQQMFEKCLKHFQQTFRR